MNKAYALDVLKAVEHGTLESRCSLAKEAYRYLESLKSTDNNLLDRIFTAKNKQW